MGCCLEVLGLLSFCGYACNAEQCLQSSAWLTGRGLSILHMLTVKIYEDHLSVVACDQVR